MIYGDAPVCDFKSWPGGKGKGKGSPPDWAALLPLYGFKTEAEALACRGNPDRCPGAARQSGSRAHPRRGRCRRRRPGGREHGHPRGALPAARRDDPGHSQARRGPPPSWSGDPTPVVEFILEHTGAADEQSTTTPHAGAIDPRGPIEYRDMKTVVDREGVHSPGYRFQKHCQKPSPWQAKWIWLGDGPQGQGSSAPVGMFRKQITLAEAPAEGRRVGSRPTPSTGSMSTGISFLVDPSIWAATLPAAKLTDGSTSP